MVVETFINIFFILIHRHTGHITGVGDVDSIRWPGSRWRSLMVGNIPKFSFYIGV